MFDIIGVAGWYVDGERPGAPTAARTGAMLVTATSELQRRLVAIFRDLLIREATVL